MLNSSLIELEKIIKMAIKTFQASALVIFIFTNFACTSDNGSNENLGCIVHPDSYNKTLPGSSYGNKSLQLSWEIPTSRENGSLLKNEDIDSYLIVSIPKDGLKDYYDQMYIIDPDNFKKIPAGTGIYLPQDSIPKLATSLLPYAVRVKCTGATKFLSEKMKPGIYYMAIITIDTEKLYSTISNTISVTIEE